MKIKFTVVFIAILALFASQPANAADKNEKMVGKVSVDKNDKDKVKGITLTTDAGALKVELAGKALDMAKEADGLTVEVKGKKVKAAKEGEEEKLLIQSYKLVFIGTVSVEKDGKKVKSVSLGSFDVKLDAKGKKLASKADGKEVTAYGKIIKTKTGKGKEKTESETLMVKSFKIKGEE